MWKDWTTRIVHLEIIYNRKNVGTTKMSMAGSGLMKSVMMGHEAVITSEDIDKNLITWENCWWDRGT